MAVSIDQLLAGNSRFIKTLHNEKKWLFKDLDEKGQAPSTLIITCSDSRVSPNQIFDAEPGTLFVVRNIAGFAPPYEIGGGHHGTIAAIEFAFEVLAVRSAIILTHSHCAGIAYGSSPKPSGFRAEHPNLAKWLDAMNLPVSPTQIPDIEQEAARMSLRNLAGYPCVIRALADSAIKLAAMHFDIKSGKVEIVG